MNYINDYLCVYQYDCMLIFVKLTLSACLWRWSCVRYTWAEDVGASGAGDA